MRRTAALGAVLLAVLVGGHSYLRVLPTHRGAAPVRSTRTDEVLRLERTRVARLAMAAPAPPPQPTVTMALTVLPVLPPRHRPQRVERLLLPTAPVPSCTGLRAPPRA